MAKNNTTFLCTECGDSFPKWYGKCPNCNEWNTIKEYKEPQLKKYAGSESKNGVDLIDQQKTASTSDKKPLSERTSTGISEVDRVLGGGFFAGSLTLFGGSPGIGKSTLSLQIFLDFLKNNKEKSFYFSGEESFDQVFHRAKRLSSDSEVLEKLKSNLFSTNSLEDVIQTVEKHNPSFAIVDSIQMIGLENARLGNLAQIKINAEVLLKLAKSTNTTIVVIGHVTKDDEIAGPKALEHIVDTVLQLEGERNSGIRLLRASKNRFGSTLEVGVFEMQSKGLIELLNPSEFFLSERAENAFGSVITVMREGARNFLTEIQALTVRTHFGLPKRTSHGIDLSKMHLLLAVISKFTNLSCDGFDAYINITSGMKVKEPACDLAILVALLSSRAEKEISANTIILGEVGLSGEIRSVPDLLPRLKEAEKLGFTKAIIPKQREKLNSLKKIKVIEIKTIKEMVGLL